MAGRAGRVAPVAAPLLLYALISVVLIGRPVIGHLGSMTMGSGGDPAASIWCLKWWAEVLTHGWSPTHSGLIWAPGGFNMTWVQSSPGPSVLLAPLTQVAGPIVSYNTLILLSPAISGWATFMLCRAAGARYLPSLAGGYALAFSSYMMGQAPGHPSLSLVAPVPFAAFLALRRLQGRLGVRWFVAALTGTLVFQYLTSTEVFLTMTMMAAATLALAALLYRDRREDLRRVLPLIVLAYVITGLLVSPLLYASVSDHSRLSPLNPFSLSLDPVGLLVPTELTAIGGSLFNSVSSRFSAGPGELGAYLGPVLILILGLFAWERRRERATALLAGVFAIAVALAMGPRLNVLGDITAVRLPWTAFIHLPITKFAAPSRIVLYAWVAVAVAVALWLSRGAWWRWSLAGLAAIALLPNTSWGGPVPPYVTPDPSASYWHSPRPVPDFFADGTAKRLLTGRRVLLIPYGWADDAEDMLWQASADMSFSMPEAYVGSTIPPEFLCWPVVQHLLAAEYLAADRRDLAAFLKAKGVTRVVVGDEFAGAAAPLLSELGPPKAIGGVQLYEVPREPGRSPRGKRNLMSPTSAACSKSSNM